MPDPITSEGFVWTPDDGLREGDLACRGVVQPAQKFNGSSDDIYDVIVVGAGYAGLVAARDLATSCESTSRRVEARVGNTKDELTTPFQATRCCWWKLVIGLEAALTVWKSMVCSVPCLEPLNLLTGCRNVV